MFNAFQHCIYCHKELPKDRSTIGEHIFPANVYGFWRSHDVCAECMQYFGDNVDNLTLSHPHILRGIEQLGLPKLEDYLRNLRYEARDVFNGRKVEMIRRDGSFQTKTTFNEDKYLECSEVNWEKIGIQWAINHNKHKVCSEQLEQEIEEIKKNYSKLKPGESITSDLLNYTVRKSRVTEVKLDKSAVPSITPLIAKITTAFLFYFLPVKVTLSIQELELLIDHARRNIELPKYFINPCAFTQEEFYEQLHAVSVHYDSFLLIIDVTFFGSINWRLLLRPKEKVVFQEIDGHSYVDFMFIQDFNDMENKKKYLAIKPIDSDEYIRYLIPV